MQRFHIHKLLFQFIILIYSSNYVWPELVHTHKVKFCRPVSYLPSLAPRVCPQIGSAGKSKGSMVLTNVFIKNTVLETNSSNAIEPID